MKASKFFLLFIMCFAFNVNAQKIGVVDTQYILDKLPQYKEAESKLNTQIQTWEKDIQNLQSEYERKKRAFESEKVLLIGDQLRQRQKEVTDLEQNIKTTVSLRFGTNGEIATLRANLTQPFQDQIWQAIRTMSEKNGLGIVFDKSNDVNVIFLQKRFDYTDKVLDLLIGKQDKKTSSKK